MDFFLTLLLAAVVWRVLTLRYQRARIALLGRHLAGLQLERHMETLTQGYTRAIHENDESRQLQVLDTFGQTEQAVAAQLRKLADAMQKEYPQTVAMSVLPFCVPYIERFFPGQTRDFRELLQIHAASLRQLADNTDGLAPKDRAFHLSAALYLFQHSCHWFCKSKGVADARLMLRHKVDHQKVLDSVPDSARAAYQRWLRGS